MYGLDIETDTTEGGLDPSRAAIVAVAISGADWHVVLDGDESAILAGLDAELRRLDNGVLVTWNGARFDLPYIADRACAVGVSVDLELEADPRYRSRHEPLPGHAGGYRARWHGHDHLDAYNVYRADVGASLGLPCGLKPLARLVGFAPVEVDRSQIHALSEAELHAYVASDAVVTRQLALHRWPTAVRARDQLVGGSAMQV